MWIKKTGDKIRNLELAGVKVDEDFKRYYPYDALASKVLDLPEVTIRESSDWK